MTARLVDENTFETIAKDEKGTKYQFKIARDTEKRRWVVDDVLIRQKKKGTSATKSVSEVMDLLLTVREFLTTLQSNDRSAILPAICLSSARTAGTDAGTVDESAGGTRVV